jgi:hypothetical protein
LNIQIRIGERNYASIPLYDISSRKGDGHITDYLAKNC